MTTMPESAAFVQLLDDCKQRVDQTLEHWLPATDINPANLHQAMRYSVLGSQCSRV